MQATKLNDKDLPKYIKRGTEEGIDISKIDSDTT